MNDMAVTEAFLNDADSSVVTKLDNGMILSGVTYRCTRVTGKAPNRIFFMVPLEQERKK